MTIAELAAEPKWDKDGYVRCRVCGCTEREPCNPPCAWVEEDLCTLCALIAEALAEWKTGAHRANVAALMREVSRKERAL
jgi:hypothetical protein